MIQPDSQMFSHNPPPTMFPAQWYAVQTRSRFEKAVREDLDRNRIENYLPVFHECHQWKDRRKVVEVPLFPGYVFVRFSREANALRQRVLRTAGVVRILGSCGEMEPVPDYEVSALRALTMSGSHFTPHPFLREGSWVRVRKGALAGIEGRLVRVKSLTRLVLSVSLLSQSVSTEVDAHYVEPVPERRFLIESASVVGAA